MCRPNHSNHAPERSSSQSKVTSKIFASVRRCADPITPTMPPNWSRSQSKVTSLKTFEFCTPSIFLLPLEGNAFKLGQMFTSGRRCTETLSKQCRLKVQSQLNFMEFHVLSISPLPLEGTDLQL